MNHNCENEIRYLLKFMDEYIEQTVYSVLEDSEENPEFSAVTATNLIICYIRVLNSLHIACSYSSVNEYLRSICLTPDEIEVFMKKRTKEAQYYIGNQYEE